MEVTFLGTGTSQGVPVIACNCEVCQSNDFKDSRLRTSIMVSNGGKNVVIDSGPDFRAQMLREKVQSLEAIVFTHEHKDHIAGTDDVRAFNFKQKKDMDLYATPAVEKALKREFYYAFGEKKYPGVPLLNIVNIDKETSFEVADLTFKPLEVMHYKMPVLGFRIGDFAYITDAKTIAPEEYEKLRGVKVLVLNALRKEEHLSHLNLEEAIEIVKDLKPEKAYFTHISHLMGTHEEVSQELPENISIAHDGLKISV
ncbi:MBL fold metallo-hydrolase [Halocola ammonii]